MICINLLPPDELKRITFRQKKTPIVPILFILFFSVLMLWVGFIFSISHLRIIVYKKVTALEKVLPQKNEIDTIWGDIHDVLLVKKKHIESVMLPQLEWAKVLNAISDFTTQGIWLSHLELIQKDGRWLLTIGGFAKQVTERSMLKDIGSFVTNVKNHIETSLMKKIEHETDLDDFVEVSTVTKRKRAYNVELTEFITTFKISV